MKRGMIVTAGAGLIFAAGCGDGNTDPDNEDLAWEEEASDELGTEVYVPASDNYPITFAYLEDSEGGEDYDTLVVYYHEALDGGGESMDEDAMEDWEEENNASLLYERGADGNQVIDLMFTTFETEAPEGEEVEINGEEVMREEAGDTIHYTIPAADGTYLVSYTPGPEAGEEDAESFVGDLIDGSS